MAISFSVIVSLFGAASAATVAYAGHAIFWRGDWRALLGQFVSGPGSTSRLLLTAFVAFNMKSMPFMWTFRVFGAMCRHLFFPRKALPQRSLFHYSITSTHSSLMETDYNIHKSNSTYFADLDVSRTHLVTYLMGSGATAIGDNLKTKLVRFPETDKLVSGTFGIGLGAVFCSFRKEIAPYQGYEIWSRVLAWDRKWLYIVSHYVVKGKVRPASWDSISSSSSSSKKMATEWTAEDEARLQKYVFATAVSKYVFKLGRFTVHPSYVIEASDLLPERPGQGWRGGEAGVGDLGDLDKGDDVLGSDSEKAEAGPDAGWTWRDVERERQKGMVLADHFAALDAVNTLFDGGKDGALGHFALG